MFTAEDYRVISNLAFRDEYPGYKKTVIESPNGDGKWDEDKRYAHVAKKYLDKETNPFVAWPLQQYLEKALDHAIEVAIGLGIPKEFWPNIGDSTLRILEYPPGSVSHSHVDFDLFTLMGYRNIPENFAYTEAPSNHLLKANELNKNIHFGEILELINPLYTATPHKVIADKHRTQFSIVFFAIPDHDAVLPNGITVGKWLNERISRSRSEAV